MTCRLSGMESLVAELTNIDGEGGNGHGVEAHGAHSVVGAEDRAQEVALKMELLHVVLKRDVGGLSREVADDYDRGIS